MTEPQSPPTTAELRRRLDAALTQMEQRIDQIEELVEIAAEMVLAHRRERHDTLGDQIGGQP